MIKRLLSPLLIATCGVFGAASGAHALNMVEISGDNVSYFYDSDFWGLNTATISGTTLVFDTRDLLNASAAVSPVKGKNSNEGGWADQVGIFAVARQGYSLSTKLDNSIVLHGQYNTGTSGVSFTNSYRDFGGQYANGIFTPSRPQEAGYGFGLYSIRSSNASPTTQFDTAYMPAYDYGIKNFQALRVTSRYDLTTWQTDHGSTTGSVDQVAYKFELSRVAPVPEPETYAMLLGGLALLAAARRRPSRR